MKTLAPALSIVRCPLLTVPAVLMFHGLEDQALLPGALSGTWEWVEKDLTIVTIPGASHFVQQDAPQMVSNTMVDWLGRRRPTGLLAREVSERNKPEKQR